MPALASASAQEAPPGPPPTTATRSFRPSGSLVPAQTMTRALRREGCCEAATALCELNAEQPASGRADFLRRELVTATVAAVMAPIADTDHPPPTASGPVDSPPPRNARGCTAGCLPCTGSARVKASAAGATTDLMD
mmetsp:Transcript_50445/g.139998  ORF Transcript_50445/g.139998 Transcript_50445/m.139998 type:complete len:137 (-) Transcript_50445:60-470(-)